MCKHCGDIKSILEETPFIYKHIKEEHDNIVSILEDVVLKYESTSSKTLIVDKELVHYAKIIVDVKKRFWCQHAPNIIFDEYGRAELGNIPKTNDQEKISEFSNEYWKFNYHFYTKYFREYLKENKYVKIKVYDCLFEINDSLAYKHIDNLKEISPYDFFADGYFHFLKDNDKIVKVKITRVLQGIFSIWKKSEDAYDYNKVCKELKELRNKGLGYDNFQVSSLSSEKKSIEETLPNFIYDKIINESDSTNKVKISINPLDKLVSSGPDDSDHITKFSTCWSNKIINTDESLTFEGQGAYADPLSQFIIGSNLNCAMMYIQNNNKLHVLNSDFNFNGYIARAHCWIDFNENTKKILVEKSYPSLGWQDKFLELFRQKNDDFITFFDTSITAFDFQDYEMNKFNYNFFDITDSGIFLDRICYQANYDSDFNRKVKMYSMDNNRASYNYDDGFTIPDSNYYSCSSCDDTVSSEDIRYIGDTAFCQYCYDNYTCYCDRCNERRDSEANYIADENGHVLCLCNDCADEYSTCDKCGGTFVHTIEFDGSDFCKSCIDKVSIECKVCGERVKPDEFNCELNQCIYCCNAEKEVEESVGDCPW